MLKDKGKRVKFIKNLTPQRAWEQFVPNSVELFISFFRAEEKPITQIPEMCKLFAKDIFNEMDMPYTMETLIHLAGLFERHIAEHIEKMGGFDKLKLYTKEEVEAIEDASIADLMKVIDAFYKKSHPN